LQSGYATWRPVGERFTHRSKNAAEEHTAKAAVLNSDVYACAVSCTTTSQKRDLIFIFLLLLLLLLLLLTLVLEPQKVSPSRLLV